MQDKTGNLSMSFVIVIVIAIILLLVTFIVPLILSKVQDNWDKDNSVIIELTE